MRLTKKQKQDKAKWLVEQATVPDRIALASEADYVQHMIIVHGFDAFDNPMMIDKVRMLLALGFKIEMPTAEELIVIAERCD